RHFFPLFGLSQGLYETCNCDNSSYHAMQIKVQKRASRGLDFLVTYTYGKAMSNAATWNGTQGNSLNWWEDHGPANFDRTHTFTIIHVWQLPVGRGRHWSPGSKALDTILGG